MSEAQKIWLAAVIDCEGCICLGSRKFIGGSCYSGLIDIVNTDRRLIERIKEILQDYKFGLTYQENSPGRFGKKPQFRIFIRGTALKSVLQEILPYLILKKEIAERLIAWRIYLESRKHFSIIQRRLDRNKYDRIANWVRELMPRFKLAA